MNITPIRTWDDHRKAVARVEDIWGAEEGTPEFDELDVLFTLIEAFETKHCPIAPPDPVDAILFCMEQRNLTPADLIPYLGQQSRVSEVLSRKRQLSLKMIRRLHAGLGIPLSSLIGDTAEPRAA